MWYSEEQETLLRELNTDRAGLCGEEAADRLRIYGRNSLHQRKRKNPILRFFSAFADKMTLVLLIAAGISFAADRLNGEFSADPFIILAIVLLNAAVTLFQESRAEKALEALKRISAPECTVLRDGKTLSIPGEEVVPGDVVRLTKGQIVPCDGRLLEAEALLTDEAALTGESGGIRKDASRVFPPETPTGDIANAVWAGTAVIGGSGTFVAVKTGMDTAMGSIASLLDGDEEKTPLQARLAKLSGLFGNLTIGICAVIFLLSLWKGLEPKDMFLTSVSLAVAAIPEGLPAIVTIVLSLGVQRMAKQRAIVRRLPAVETLGCAGVICSDKTGTLTCNRMTVTDVYGDKDRIARASILCNDRASPTEDALWDAAVKAGADPDALLRRFPRVRTLPFDSDVKRMLTLHRAGNRYVSCLKGAPDVLSRFCGGLPTEASDALRRMADNALRVIGFAVAESDFLPSDPLRQRFRFLGLCGMEDPPREGVEEAVRQCAEAGILPVMITGDHAATASAVARKIGILREGNACRTEAELRDLSDEQLAEQVRTCTVFARTTPAFKMRIVDAYRQNGYVVAMTGDGVNDAPALKKADIGCAMGKGGTEVAREASDLILTDDNFSTVVGSVREGRTIYSNIRRAVHFLLSCNIGEIVTVLLGILLSLPAPLAAIQLLWVNLVTDSLPAISLGLERPAKDIMQHPPGRRDEPLFPALRWLEIFAEGILIGCLSLLAFGLGALSGGFAVGRTMAFTVLAVSQLVHAFNMRSARSLRSVSLFSNPWLLGSFLLGTAIQVAIVQMPVLCGLFLTVPLNGVQWLCTAALCAFPLLYCELYKRVKWGIKRKVRR